MLIILLLAVVSMMALVLVLLVIVVVGIKQEPPTDEMNIQAPSLLAALVRRSLGVSVLKPDHTPHRSDGEPYLTALRRGRR